MEAEGNREKSIVEYVVLSTEELDKGLSGMIGDELEIVIRGFPTFVYLEAGGKVLEASHSVHGFLSYVYRPKQKDPGDENINADH